MPKNLSVIQQRKIYAAQRYILHSSDPDLLFNIVVIIGPSLFGSIFQSNADTVWSRIDDPFLFRLEELLKIAKALDVTVFRLLEIVLKQIEHNTAEKKQGRPIGKDKFKGP